MSDQDRFTDALQQATTALELNLPATAIERMWAYNLRVIDANRNINLTRITEPAAAAVKLFADSLAPLSWAQSTGESIETVLDIGTGAGFPAAPLAIARSNWQVTAIDATAKKIDFVQGASAELQIANLRTEHARAEHWRDSKRFDLVTLKAVGRLARCVTFAHQFVARNGVVAVFKSAGVSRKEVDAGQRTAEQTGLTVWDVLEYELPLGDVTLSSALFVLRRIG